MIGHTMKEIKQQMAYAICGTCGKAGPLALNEQDAKILAEGNGWKLQDATIKANAVTIFTCDECKTGTVRLILNRG